DGVAQDLDLRGFRVGFDDGRVHAGSDGRTVRRVEVPPLEPGFIVLVYRWLVLISDRELGRGLRSLVERVAQWVGQYGKRAQLDPVGRAALHLYGAVHQFQVRLVRLERVGREPQGLLLRAQRGQVHRRTA